MSWLDLQSSGVFCGIGRDMGRHNFKARVSKAWGDTQHHLLWPHQLNSPIPENLDVLNNKPFQKMDGTRRSLLKPLPETHYVFAR